MPEFNVLLRDGRTLTLDSPNAATADRDAATWQAQNPPAKADPLRGEAYKSTRDIADRGGVLSDIGGAAANFNASLPLVQDIQAGLATAVDPRTYQGKPGEAYRSNREAIRANTESFRGRRPVAANVASTAGLGATMAVPGVGTAGLITRAPANASAGARLANTAMNTARGAVAAGSTGGAYALGSDGTIEQRLENARNASLMAAGFGGPLGALAGRGAPRAPTTRQENIATLLDSGVFLTPGVRVGGLAKNAEDLAKRAPILGPAITGARDRSVESLNRSLALNALAPIDEALPTTVRTGNEAVAFVRDRLGATYNRAADLVPRVVPDAPMATNLSQIGTRTRDLAKSHARQFERIVRDRVGRLGSGTSGREAMSVADEIEGLAAGFSSSQDGSQRIMGDMLEDVAGEIRGLIARASPEAQALINRADRGYSIYVRLRNAASKGKDGIALPGGIRTAVRMEDKSVGKGRVATGEAELYDLANASHQLSDEFGNPGTANALGLGALLVGAGTRPLTTAAATAGLGGAALPYFAMGRQVLERLPANATHSQMLAARRTLSELAARDPSVRQLEQALALRMYQATGALGAAMSAAGAAR